MTDDEIVDYVKTQLYNWALGDVKGASKNAKMGGFILASCLIDYLANFYSIEKYSGDRYKEFCSKYFSQYDTDDLYYALRCKLVHNYTEGGKYVFTDDNKVGRHFDEISGGKILLNLENFIIDIENAMGNYFVDAGADKTLRNRLINRYNENGILGLVPSTTFYRVKSYSASGITSED